MTDLENWACMIDIVADHKIPSLYLDKFHNKFIIDLRNYRDKYQVSELGKLYEIAYSDYNDHRIILYKTTEIGKKPMTIYEWKAYIKNICLEALDEDPEFNVVGFRMKKRLVSNYNIKIYVSFLKAEDLYNEVRRTKDKIKISSKSVLD